MPELAIGVENVAAVPFAAAPLLSFTLAIRNRPPEETIHTVVLRAQIQIEAQRRRYSPAETAALGDLFGESDRWSRTLRPMLWTHASVVVPAFTGQTSVELQTPCTFDFNVASVKYFYGISGGEIPLRFLFSGTIFYASPEGALQVAPISWSSEASFRLPAGTWREMMDHYYPASAWLCLRRDVFERLYEYKTRQGMAAWEDALAHLLEAAAGEPTPC